MDRPDRPGLRGVVRPAGRASPRTCSPWRDLPEELGPFQTVHKRLIRWAVDGTWERVLAALLAVADADDDVGWTVSVHSTVCRAHQHSARARKRGRPAGPSLRTTRSDGLSTKVHLTSDSRARPLSIHVTAGQAGDAPAFEAVMAGIRVPNRPAVVLADRAYSPRAIRGHLRRRGIRGDSPPIRSVTVCGEAVPEAARPASTPRHTRSATPSSGASPDSSSGAASQCGRISSPSPTRPHSTLLPSSSGPGVEQGLRRIRQTSPWTTSRFCSPSKMPTRTLASPPVPTEETPLVDVDDQNVVAVDHLGDAPDLDRGRPRVQVPTKPLRQPHGSATASQKSLSVSIGRPRRSTINSLYVIAAD